MESHAKNTKWEEYDWDHTREDKVYVLVWQRKHNFLTSLISISIKDTGLEICWDPQNTIKDFYDL